MNFLLFIPKKELNEKVIKPSESVVHEYRQANSYSSDLVRTNYFSDTIMFYNNLMTIAEFNKFTDYLISIQ